MHWNTLAFAMSGLALGAKVCRPGGRCLAHFPSDTAYVMMFPTTVFILTVGCYKWAFGVKGCRLKDG
jgi:hypothetical protein